MADGVVTFGAQRKNRTPEGRTTGSRTINCEVGDFIKDRVAELVHGLIVVILILAAARLPPGLMRPKRRHELPVRLQLLGWNRPTGLIAEEPAKRVLQEMSFKAARQPASWLHGEPTAIPRVAPLPSLEFKLFYPLRNGQGVDRRCGRVSDRKTARSKPTAPSLPASLFAFLVAIAWREH